MSTAALKQPVSFRWDTNLVNSLKKIAKHENRSLSNLTETLLARAIGQRGEEADTPNEETRAAIAEAKSGKELETLDLEHFNEYVKGL